MSATEFLCNLLEIYPHQLSLIEKLVLEIELFARICDELKTFFKERYKDYHHLMKLNKEAEDAMLDANLLRNIVNDILATEEYSLEGIALYTEAPEDVICDIVTGRIKEPSLRLSRKIIDLHRSVRPHLYQQMVRKIIADYLVASDEKKIVLSNSPDP
jgi:hypothetical protein